MTDWDNVAEASVEAVKHAAKSMHPRLAFALWFGALDVDPRHLAVHYGFATDADLELALSNGLQDRLRTMTSAELVARGYPADALALIGIHFVSEQEIDRVSGGDSYDYFKG